jgi:hypothetical protein
MNPQAQRALDKAIATESKVFVEDWVQDSIYQGLKRWLVEGAGCLFRKGGYDIWLDSDIVNGHFEGFVMARKTDLATDTAV